MLFTNNDKFILSRINFLVALKCTLMEMGSVLFMNSSLLYCFTRNWSTGSERLSAVKSCSIPSIPTYFNGVPLFHLLCWLEIHKHCTNVAKLSPKGRIYVSNAKFVLNCCLMYPSSSGYKATYLICAPFMSVLSFR